MSQLAKYLELAQEKQKDFAARVKVSPSVLNRIVKGQVRPGLDLALRISEATSGLVPVETWRKQNSLVEQVDAPAGPSSEAVK